MSANLSMNIKKVLGAVNFVKRAKPSLIILPVALLMAACGEAIESTSPPPPVENVVWKLATKERSIIMMRGATQQLTPIAINLDGNPVSVGAGLYKFTSSNEQVATVDGNGLVTAIATTDAAPIELYVTLRKDNVMRIDTLFLSITATSVNIKSFQLIPMDSLRQGAQQPIMVFHSLIDENDNQIFDLYPKISFKSSSLALDFGGGIYLPYAAGEMWFYGTITAYGKTFTDSLRYDIINPAYTPVTFSTRENGELSLDVGLHTLIQPCGTVDWQNWSQDTIVVKLANTSAAGKCTEWQEDGDVGVIPPGSSVSRTFPNAGKVEWTLTKKSAPSPVLFNGSIKIE